MNKLDERPRYKSVTCPKCKSDSIMRLPVGTKGTLFPSFHPDYRCECGWEFVARHPKEKLRDQLDAAKDAYFSPDAQVG